MTTMQQQLKRKSIITQLKEIGVQQIDGEDLEDVVYSTLPRTLAIKRARRNEEE